MKKRLLPFCAIIAALILLSACMPAVPLATPAIATAEPTPVPPPTATPRLFQTPAPTPMPPDAAFESEAAPLSRNDFTVQLPGGAFCLLDQSSAELESLLGENFADNKLQTADMLFTQLDSYVGSVFFFGTPTPRGIKQGDALEAVLEAYGTPSEIDDLGDTSFYLYYVEPESSEGLDFNDSRPMWYYHVGFTILDDKVDSAFIEGWTTE